MALSEMSIEDLQAEYTKTINIKERAAKAARNLKAEIQKRDVEMRTKAQAEKDVLKQHARQTAANAAAK